MPASRPILAAVGLALALAVAPAGGAAPDAAPPQDGAPAGEPSEETQGGYGHLKPLLLETDKPAPPPGTRNDRDRPSDAAAGRAAVEVDAKTRTVRVPVRVTHARGVVEWVLSAGGRHRRMSVLLTRCPVRAVARALAQTGLAEGRPPQPVGEDAARPPAGPAVRLTLLFRREDGSAARVPAEHLLAAAPHAEPLAEGRWVYVGPQTLPGENVLLAELSGSLVTTSLRDTSAMVYWVPASGGDGPRYVKAVYARPEAVPAEVTEAVLELRAAAGSDGAAAGSNGAGAPRT